jgi:hypothetical protein
MKIMESGAEAPHSKTRAAINVLEVPGHVLECGRALPLLMMQRRLVGLCEVSEIARASQH